MASDAATEDDFERDYPALKSDYLRGEALKQDTARDAMRRRVFESI